ncbi:MAG TPA: DUF971 domain-containing protein [Terracidiphilus sp.]|jgi:DUF971 family protein|nr:DUF971 domain-containing protein [Terracidiphilus sp.]
MSHEGIRLVSPEEQAREDFANRPLPRIAMTPQKVRVLLTEGKGVEIDWQDGHRSAWTFAWLRDACPCATCVDERINEGRKTGEGKPKSAELLPMYKPAAKPASVQPVGRYALQFNWLDGHTAGLFSWEYLRRHCQCAECRFAASDAPGQPQ